MTCCSARAARGFTLLEILVAITILGIILTTVFGAVSRTLSSKQVGEERAELFASGRQAVLKIADEIEAAWPPQAGDRLLFRGSSSTGQPPADSVEFVTMNRGGYGLDRVRPGLVLIAYSLDPLPESRELFALRREQHLFAALLAAADGVEPPEDPALEDEAPTAVASYLLDCPRLPGEIGIAGSCIRVVGLRFRYFDDAVNTWREEWDTASGVTQDRLPAAVEIALFLADERGAMHDFTTIVDLPLARAQPTPQPGRVAAEDAGETGESEGIRVGRGTDDRDEE